MIKTDSITPTQKMEPECYECGVKNIKWRYWVQNPTQDGTTLYICKNSWARLTHQWKAMRINGQRVYPKKSAGYSCYSCGSVKTWINCRGEPVWRLNRGLDGRLIGVLCGSCDKRLNSDYIRKYPTTAALSEFRSKYAREHVSPIHLREIGMKAHRVQAGRMSNLEKIMMSELTGARIPFTPQYEYALGFIDFLVYPNIAVYCDGEYWHDYPRGTKKDHKQNEYLQSNGYIVVRFWEREIKKNVKSCITQIKSLLTTTSNNNGRYLLLTGEEEES